MSHMQRQLQSQAGLNMLKRVRQICAPLPEVVEKIDGFGHTTMRIADKPFVFMGEKDGVPTMSFKADPFMQELLLQQDDYFKTPYIGHHGWVSVASVAKMQWDEVEPLIAEAYRRAAPKRILKQLGVL
ncbi:MmcQ/YjbR family DNA-binding protein [Paenibacillus piri]|uniref:MmcQ/YjbR family DNA-binding protein n=1 Tax=Paenibacillus piri TaxID=2547395 RepID=A0A4V2ZTD9_9BACL|nr:MmcQ/YjbR family DNA-binding protein [Paenibacillus piri]TDF96754.1 MmcQ/YjbR family DNA-binding protein [Paenibacillus piri]